MIKRSSLALLSLGALALAFTSGVQAIGVPVEVGQSFTPKLAGSTPDALPLANSFATLTDFTFVTGGGLPNTLYITAGIPTSPSTIASQAIATSSSFTDLANDPRFGNARTRVYHFSTGASLDTDLTYLALFDVATADPKLSLSSSNPYASGQVYVLQLNTYSAGPSGYDARSGATFASAIPEPSTCAALTGLGVLALAGLRRRRAV